MTPKFASSLDAKKAGWFSRRHQTAAAHHGAQEEYRERKARKLARAQDGVGAVQRANLGFLRGRR